MLYPTINTSHIPGTELLAPGTINGLEQAVVAGYEIARAFGSQPASKISRFALENYGVEGTEGAVSQVHAAALLGLVPLAGQLVLEATTGTPVPRHEIMTEPNIRRANTLVGSHLAYESSFLGGPRGDTPLSMGVGNVRGYLLAGDIKDKIARGLDAAAPVLDRLTGGDGPRQTIQSEIFHLLGNIQEGARQSAASRTGTTPEQAGASIDKLLTNTDVVAGLRLALERLERAGDNTVLSAIGVRALARFGKGRTLRDLLGLPLANKALGAGAHTFIESFSGALPNSPEWRRFGSLLEAAKDGGGATRFLSRQAPYIGRRLKALETHLPTLVRGLVSAMPTDNTRPQMSRQTLRQLSSS